jgi:hypothetical protein
MYLSHSSLNHASQNLALDTEVQQLRKEVKLLRKSVETSDYRTREMLSAEQLDLQDQHAREMEKFQELIQQTQIQATGLFARLIEAARPNFPTASRVLHTKKGTATGSALTTPQVTDRSHHPPPSRSHPREPTEMAVIPKVHLLFLYPYPPPILSYHSTSNVYPRCFIHIWFIS